MANTLSLPESLRQIVDRELKPGETIRWIEQPAARFFTPTTTGIFVAGLVSLGIFGAFIFYWLGLAPGGSEPPDSLSRFVRLGGLLVGTLCLLMSAVPLAVPVLHWQAARQTVYLITDQRAVIVQGSGKATIRSFGPIQLRETYRRERPNGSGDIVFAVRQWIDSGGDAQSEEIGFLNIQNVKRVEGLLRSLK